MQIQIPIKPFFSFSTAHISPYDGWMDEKLYQGPLGRYPLMRDNKILDVTGMASTCVKMTI